LKYNSGINGKSNIGGGVFRKCLAALASCIGYAASRRDGRAILWEVWAPDGVTDSAKHAHNFISSLFLLTQDYQYELPAS